MHIRDKIKQLKNKFIETNQKFKIIIITIIIIVNDDRTKIGKAPMMVASSSANTFRYEAGTRRLPQEAPTTSSW